MKNVYYLIVILFSSSSLLAQVPEADFDIINCEPITGDYLFAAKTELSNIQYLEFLSHQKGKISNEQYLALLPDSSQWNKVEKSNSAYTDVYLRHPAYRDYPCVNLSKKQAEAYCVWLTGMLNYNLDHKEDHPVKEVLVRLPTEREWEKAARAGDEKAIFPWAGKSMRSDEKKFQGQLRAAFVRGRGDYMGVAGNLNDNADLTAPVFTYWPNDYGLYNMAGNVSEMVSDKAISKGGGWKSLSMNLEIDTFEVFNKPLATVGFRYFVEVISLKDNKRKEKSLEKLLKDFLIFIPSSNFKTRDSSISIQSFYMSQTEITNDLFAHFTKENSRYIPKGDHWKYAVPYGDRLANDYATHSKYANFPVVNISRKAMDRFCEWLTEKYKSLDKKEYKGLKFRLPTEIEWELAASGGRDLSEYPWGGPYLRNSKGCFLANHSALPNRWINITDTSFVKTGISPQQIYSVSNLDGAYIPSDVHSYHPNDYGLYNMSGNVAELIADRDVTKGGSWGSFEYHLPIKSVQMFRGATPFVGFRVVATYLEKNNK